MSNGYGYRVELKIDIMTVLFIKSLNSKGNYQDFYIGHCDFDSCFNMLSELANSSCQLEHVILSMYKGHSMPLPVKAFDGELVGKTFRVIQREWEILLHESE